MASAFTPSQAQDLINSFALIEQRQLLSRKRFLVLRAAIEERKEDLKTYAQQAVRLVSLMTACRRGGYVDFLYNGLPSVRLARTVPVYHADHFRILVYRARDEGRLGGRFRVSETGVDFFSAEHDLKGRRYNLGFGAMPLAAGFLELFLTSAGIEDIDAIVGSMRGGEGDNLIADDRSAALLQWLDGWLASRVKSEHFTRHFQVFRDLTEGLAGARVTFWNDMASGSPVARAQIALPARIRKAASTKPDTVRAPPVRSQSEQDELKRSLGTDELARMMEEFRKRQAGNGNPPPAPPAPPRLVAANQPTSDAGVAGTTARPVEKSLFDGLVMEPVPIDDWHRRRWPEAYAAFVAGGAETKSDVEEHAGDYSALVTDETILAIWTEVNRDQELSRKLKMRKFRTAARLLFDYRTSLRLSARRINPDQADSLTRADGREEEFETDRVIVWTSPLAPLVVQSAVNWLNKDDIARLACVLEASDKDQSTLFAGSPPDPAFARTLLRYMHFGGEQDGAMKGLRCASGGYVQVAEDFGALRTRIRKLACATAYALALRESVRALDLMEWLEPGIVDALDIGTVIRSREDDLTLAIRFARPRLTDRSNPVGKVFRDCFDAINRAGFRKEDSDVEDFDEAFSSGAEYLPLIAGAVEDVWGWLTVRGENAAWLAGAEAADEPRFRAVFARMYEEAPAVPA